MKQNRSPNFAFLRLSGIFAPIINQNVKSMWILGKQNIWVNIENALRISKSGDGDYIVVCSDGKNVKIDQTAYDRAMRWVDPDWYEKHPDGNKNSLDLSKALKAIMKATGAKLEDKKEEEE